MDSPMLQYIKHIMIISGTMPLSLINSHKLLYRLYQYFVQVSVTSFLVFKYGAIFNIQGSIETVFESANMIVIYTILYIKGRVCMTNNMGKLISKLITDEKTIMKSDDTNILKIYNGTLRKSKVIEICYIGLIYLVLFSFITPHYINYIQVLTVNGNDNSTLEKTKLYNWWLPFDADKYYFVTLFLQSYCAVMSSNYFCFIQVILILLPINISLRLKVLRIKLENINRIYEGREDNTAMKKLISVYVEEHIDIIRYCSFHNDTIKYIMLLEFLVITAELSLGLFMLVSATESRVRIFSASYILQTLGQLLITYWYADQIRGESVAVTDSVYKINWYKYDRSVRSSIQIMIMRCQQPLSLTVGPFGNITLEMAVKIIKASYTYVAFMQQTYGNSDSVF